MYTNLSSSQKVNKSKANRKSTIYIVLLYNFFLHLDFTFFLKEIFLKAMAEPAAQTVVDQTTNAPTSTTTPAAPAHIQTQQQLQQQQQNQAFMQQVRKKRAVFLYKVAKKKFLLKV